MKSKKKQRAVILLTIASVVIIYVTYICVNYLFYNSYKKHLKEYSYEEGKEYSPLNKNKSLVIGMELVAENEELKLYTNTKTTEIAIYNKKNDEIIYSNPVDREEDSVATGRNKTALNSQFMITYYDNSMTESTMYNYDYSVEKNQYEMESIDNGIRYTYLMGNLDSPTGIVPPVISVDRLEELVISKVSAKEAKALKSSYIESKNLEGFLELTAGAKTNKVGMNKLIKIFDAAGYTMEDFDEDAALASDGNIIERTTFTVVVEYRIVNDKLEVTVPTDKIKETGKGKIASIDLLSFFGAAGKNEEGYMFVPNGSGSLISFNNGKTVERYNQSIYGMDETLQSFTVVESTLKARLPVFGIKREKSAIFTEIVEGESLANLISNVANSAYSYNYVYPSFTIRGNEKVSMFGSTGSSADLPTLEKDIYHLDIKVAYSFLLEEEASYGGMANYYRNELIDRKVLTVKEKADSIPFYLDIIGGIKSQDSFLGIPYMSVYPMTTFDEAGIIVDEFIDNKVTNLRVNYLGWFNGGYYHDVAKNIKVERKLGGKKDLAALNKKLEEVNSTLFGDIALMKVSFASDHYNYKMESAQYYSGYVLSFGRVNPASLRQTGGMGYQETNYNIISPKFLDRYVDKMIKELVTTEISGVSLRDLGNTVTADKKRTNVINREQAKQIAKVQLEKIKETQNKVMINDANAYALEYATDIEDAPVSQNAFHIVDEEVPFYQMVIHGCIDYTSNAINLNDSYDKQDVLLKMIEFGMSPRFTLSYEESSQIKYTGLNSLYSTQYEIWMDEAVDIYNNINSVLRHVNNSTIINHEKVDSEVKKITYDNGCVIYINTSGEDVEIDGVKVLSKDYALKGVME